MTPICPSSPASKATVAISVAWPAHATPHSPPQLLLSFRLERGRSPSEMEASLRPPAQRCSTFLASCLHRFLTPLALRSKWQIQVSSRLERRLVKNLLRSSAEIPQRCAPQHDNVTQASTLSEFAFRPTPCPWP